MSPEALDEGTRFRVPPDVSHQAVGGKVVLVNFATDRVYELDGTGRAVWERVVAGDTVADMRAHLRARYVDDAGRIDGDLRSCLEHLLDCGLTECSVNG